MMDMAELSDRIGQGEDLYAGARPVLGSEGKPTDKGGLLDLANELRVPAWIDQSTIYNANLWLGAGDNRTMLHYDAWNTIMLVGKGSKEFFVFPNTESHKMFQYSAFNYAALLRGQVLHSPIRPLSVQKKYQSKFRTAKGFQGRAESGDIIFVPAGFWHYVESTGLNISVNFFTHYADRSLQWKEPLLTYWVKVNITEKPIEWYQNLRAWVGRLVRGLLNNPARKPN